MFNLLKKNNIRLQRLGKYIIDGEVCTDETIAFTVRYSPNNDDINTNLLIDLYIKYLVAIRLKQV